MTIQGDVIELPEDEFCKYLNLKTNGSKAPPFRHWQCQDCGMEWYCNILKDCAMCYSGSEPEELSEVMKLSTEANKLDKEASYWDRVARDFEEIGDGSNA